MFESKINDLCQKISGEIDMNGGLINEVKSQTDAQILHMKRNNADMLVIQKTITTNLQKLNLDH